MKFTVSYRALLIATLLVGGILILLITIKIGEEFEEEKNTFPVTYTETLEKDELEEKNTSTSIKKQVIKTHTAYNEAEKFLNEENENAKNNLQEILDTPIENTANNNKINFEEALDELNKSKETLEVSKEKRLKSSSQTNKKTTISYFLENRKATYLANPVYTCNASGKITLNIKVNALGKIEDATYNKVKSTTQNMCLIEAAIAYAEQSRFNTSNLKAQNGTITYLFPGQN